MKVSTLLFVRNLVIDPAAGLVKTSEQREALKNLLVLAGDRLSSLMSGGMF